MPRQLRIEYEGAIYHVVNRGDRREDIFINDRDRESFLETLGQACQKSGWQIHAYCLMRNHFHLVLETPQPTLVHGMKWFLGTYTQRFNIRHRLRGHLFAGRYKALLVDESDGHYLRVVCDYVHLNPSRARILEKETGLEAYPWSSYPAYVNGGKGRPPWLRVDRLFGEHGIVHDTAPSWREFSRRIEGLRSDPENETTANIRRGWKIGAEDFLDRIKDKVSPAQPDLHHPEQVYETMNLKADRLIALGLQKAGITSEDLVRLPKAHPIKLQIALQLRQQTTLTLPQIATALHAGAWRSLANALSKFNHTSNVSI